MPTNAGQSAGLSEGELFAGYTIVRRLGAGGMGEVYLAQHPRLPRRDALKILPRELTGDLEFRQRFNREADLAASLYNEHIVGIHDRGEFQGQLWISMDYVEGTDAAQLLRSRYPSGMPHPDVVEIISAVADALDYAHSRGLLHRDVKPANILLGEAMPRRRILLADFGIARQLGEISGLTATNMLMGTTAYCAPEQLQGADLDGRADQYALGCTAFHLLAGSAPFQHSNPAVVISQHLSSPPPSISTWRPELAHLDGVIAKALAKDPAERYPTCADFAAALAGRPATGPAPVTSPAAATELPTQVITSPAVSPNPSSSRVKPATLIAALITVALVMVAVVLGVRLLRSPSAEPGSAAQSPSTASPSGGATPPSTPALRLSVYLTDDSNVLTPAEHAVVDRALTKLYNQRGVRLWVVYVKDFGGLKPARWAENTMRTNGFADTDAMLAVATDGPAFSFRVPAAVTTGRAIDVEVIRRDRIEPSVFRHEWTRAALAAANGLDVAAR
ncbi:protein kinase domain-containing protein [Mycobacterium kansasii]|uniref:non-specific serine/threonine protein kinase n=4 Tax=Mycobacterium kansasii TaxID=1768 RepID=A0A653EJQ1_MYCKA|nr:protein kinase [Mycobacterium kansasii]AGZ53697.1 anchored-membrane serine/threonine-protein kinase PknF [Mycobacterium kansasii ATCC 12478]ARG54718.1 serine/threonine protein kinase [Mycobacterium kansasii]ARG60170.1 serine/threonine protein kinase [Mycobacterium kansasii]ARG67908.1 serine/threonine protein kinase [Mycobacterium kansasii]ARG77580.1 serine/threonine protein kinase [Mycobacterium kansasii]